MKFNSRYVLTKRYLAYGFTTEHYKIFDRSIELLKITDSDLISVKNRILEFLKELFDKENLSVIEYFINNNIFEYLWKAIEDNITYSSVEYAIKCILHIFQSEKVDDLCEKHYLLKFTDINGFERVDKAMEFIQYQELNDYWSNIWELFLSDDHNIQLYEDEENENS